MASYRQTLTAEGLQAIQEAEEQAQLVRDYKYIITNIINPARRSCGLNDKKLI